MPRPRFAKLEAEKQSHIIDVAGDEFARHGYKAASLNAIIEAAGLSKGAFYYYFDDKADLFATVLAHAHEAVFASGAPDFAALDADSFWEAAIDLGRRGIEFGRAHPWVIELSRTLHERPDEFGEPLERFLAETRQVMHAFLVRGQQLGLIRADIPFDLLVELVAALDRTMDGWVARHWPDLESGELARISHCVFSMVRSMLAPPAAP